MHRGGVFVKLIINCCPDSSKIIVSVYNEKRTEARKDSQAPFILPFILTILSLL